MYVGTLRFDGEIIPSISSNARWLFGVSVRRGRSKRNIDRKLFQSHTCLLAISAVSLVILSAQYHATSGAELVLERVWYILRSIYYIWYIGIYSMYVSSSHTVPYYNNIEDWALTGMVVNPAPGQLRTVVTLQ